MKQYTKYPKAITAAVNKSLAGIGSKDVKSLIESMSPNDTRGWRRLAESQNYWVIDSLMNPKYSSSIPDSVKKYITDTYGTHFNLGRFHPSSLQGCDSEQLANLAEICLGVNDALLADIVFQPRVSEDCLRKCASSSDYHVLSNICKNPNSPEDLILDVLDKLASGGGGNMGRVYAASSTQTPVQLLQTLAKDELAAVRYEVARNPNTPADVLIELSKDKSADVREAVASCDNTPTDIIKLLANDRSSRVKQVANQRLGDDNYYEEIISSGNRAQLQRLIEYKNVPFKYLVRCCIQSEKLSKDAIKTLVQRIGARLQEDPSILDKLS